MAGEFSTYGADKALDFLTGRALAWTATRNTFLNLTTTAPTDATPGTEVTTGGYGRQTMTTPSAWTIPADSAGVQSTSNVAAITFGPFQTTAPGTITGCELFDAATVGNRLMWWTLTTSKVPAVGESIQFAAGALIMTLE